jgi:O-antigen ligase
MMTAEGSPITSILGALGKDSTLTGRTLLWHFGLEAFNERPIIGHGYRGYWEGPTPAVLHLKAAIGQDLWHFHNNIVETLVAFGLLGLVVFLCGVLFAISATVRDFANTKSWESLWRLQIIIAVMVSSLAENVLIVNHGFMQVLFVSAVVAAPQASRQKVIR